MSEFTIEQLIKLILGIMVFVAVVIGVYMFFKYDVIDFFKGIADEDEEGFGGAGAERGLESEQGTETIISETESEPSRFCEDCGFLGICTNKKCSQIDTELRVFNKKCSFFENKKINPFDNKCITLDI